MAVVVCADFGSTYTKVSLVDLGTAQQVAATARPTTLTTDVLDGLHECLAELGRRGFAVGDAEVLGCSSAGGGLRIAVIGNEAAVTAEAGRRAALSSGGQVVATLAGDVTEGAYAELADQRPDLVLLSGGTDGGNTTMILTAARALATRRLTVPVVVAGNVDVADEVHAILADAEIQHVVVANLVPSIGRFAPDPARQAIRRLFVSHVIGGKNLSAGAGFAEMIIGATPEVVLTAAELVGGQVSGGVVVVDVGGATTDVYSCVPTPEHDPPPIRDLIETAPTNRTVEGDLGVHWSAAGTLAQGRAVGLITDTEAADGTPASPVLARAAAAIALGRHAGRSESLLVAGQRTVRVVGPDLREVELLIGSGGVFRADPDRGRALLDQAAAAAAGPGRLLPRRAEPLIDADYLLAPIGLLSASHPEVARALATRLVPSSRPD